MCSAASSMSITRSQHDGSGFPRPTGRSGPRFHPRSRPVGDGASDSAVVAGRERGQRMGTLLISPKGPASKVTLVTPAGGAG
jgi:hypothetical protein